MNTKESLRAQIRELMIAMAQNGLNLRMMQRQGNTREISSLLLARTEILKSIAHRQGLLIAILEEDVKFGIAKEAA